MALFRIAFESLKCIAPRPIRPTSSNGGASMMQLGASPGVLGVFPWRLGHRAIENLLDPYVVAMRRCRARLLVDRLGSVDTCIKMCCGKIPPFYGICTLSERHR